jgi:cyclopropane-fatty-acyl-phospholipid synthase
MGLIDRHILRRLESHIKAGSLVLTVDGRSHRFGNGKPEVDWVMDHPGTLRRISRDPEMGLGETYMAGRWWTQRGSLADLLELLLRSFPETQPQGLQRLVASLSKVVHQWNRVSRSHANVAHHYDLDESLFRKFLDRDMHYSCAYFPHPGMSLEQAQQHKCQHIMAKLRIEPSQRVLDIGSGWGGLALFLAEQAGARVTGLTLSREQLRVAQQRAAARGLQGQVQFRLEDYRAHRGSYDRIVSVGMFEHVGQPQYGAFFGQVAKLLTDEGIALLHTIGRRGPPGSTNPWIRKYIFPGGYNPAASEVLRAIENSGLAAVDLEVLRLHYAWTVAAWQQRFQVGRSAIAARMGEQFCRMWEFYLAVSEAAFRCGDLVVFQFQLSPWGAAIPVTRDYLYQAGFRGEPDSKQPDHSQTAEHSGATTPA